MAYSEAPIDRAHSAAHYLHAIDDLLVTASSADDMHLVSPEHLAFLTAASWMRPWPAWSAKSTNPNCIPCEEGEMSMSALERARVALRAKRETGELEYLDPIEKSIRNPRSLRLAINAMCWGCVGRNSDANARGEVARCTGWGCPLWPLRPYQHKAPDGYGVEKRRLALSVMPDNSPMRRVEGRENSLRRAINAKCAECMGGSSQYKGKAKSCPSKFPREKYGMDTPTGYRGCPLWPHRPGG